MWNLQLYLKFFVIFSMPPTLSETEGQLPTVKPNLEEAEQAVAVSLACATQTMLPCPPSVSIADLQTILKVKDN